jgi:hypothetical protein
MEQSRQDARDMEQYKMQDNGTLLGADKEQCTRQEDGTINQDTRDMEQYKMLDNGTLLGADKEQ